MTSQNFNFTWNKNNLSAALNIPLEHIDNFNSHKISINSKDINTDDVFIGLKGANLDGGSFALEAIQKGAALCIVNSSVKLLDNPKILKVQDTERALTKMAIFRREHFSKHTKVIAVTGSAGKTSTKEMIALSLKNFGTVGATKGNLNNHIGLPLTICNAGNELDFCVLEMGMNHSGEIYHLSKIAKPHIAIITNIGAAHLEFFNSVEDIALAKAEIYKGTTNGGWAIINEDNLYKDILKQQASLHKLNILTFGKDTESDIKLLSYETINHKTKVKVSAFGEELSYFFNTIIGKHLIINSLASIAVAKILDLDIKSAINNLIVFKPIEGRGNASMLKNGIILIDESYNANPESVKASIISMINHKAKDNRLILVLGDMRELGKESQKIHAELAAHIENIDLVYTVGEMMLEMHRKLPQNIIGAHVDTSEEMAKIITNDLKDNDIILVKGSFSMNMITIVNSILKDFSE